MASPVLWHCPYCQRHATITDENRAADYTRFDKGNYLGSQMVMWAVITCPNEACRKYVFGVSIYDDKSTSAGRVLGIVRHSWKLLPAANMKVLPDYVPAPIVADYKEACLIADLSPKASATLSRRCLQGMIRDFWGVKVRSKKLIDEIKAIEDKVGADEFAAIEAVRKVGNIGAHMEADIDVIVDVDPNEAKLLIGLIETLVEDWYVARHEKQERLKALAALADAKDAAKKPLPPTQS